MLDINNGSKAKTSTSETKQLLEALLKDANAQYDKLEKAVSAVGGEQQMRGMERGVLLNVVDQKWREHLYEMDYLKEGIGLRAMAQRDPLVEYQREGGDMFNRMKDGIKEETVRQLFMVRKQLEQAGQVQVNDPAEHDGSAPGVATDRSTQTTLGG